VIPLRQIRACRDSINARTGIFLAISVDSAEGRARPDGVSRSGLFKLAIALGWRNKTVDSGVLCAERRVLASLVENKQTNKPA
jgi:hypothetical protein